MASLYKPTIVSYRLPNGSTRTPEGERVTKDTPGAVKHTRKAKKWYGKFKGANGKEQRKPLSANKTTARNKLVSLIKKAKKDRKALKDGNTSRAMKFEAHGKRPLAEHLADWERCLVADGATPKHVRQTVACARRVLDGCGFAFIADVAASAVQTYLAGLREYGKSTQALDPPQEWYTRKELASALGVTVKAVTSLVRHHRLEAKGNGKARRYPRATAEALRALRTRGRSIKTSNLYLDAVKQFAAWLVTDKRTAENVLDHLSGGNVKLDRRHDRRALPIGELRAVIGAARRSTQTFRGMAGPDRAMIYSVACASGFRAEEMSTLRPTAFDLDGELPTVTLSAENAKNGRTAVQPLPADVVKELRTYLEDRPVDLAVWPGLWFKKAAEMLRIELDACGIPYAVEGPDGPLYADFHALRHSYVALLEKSGATLKEAMQLARHSDPKLTMAVYGRAQLNDLSAAVGKLPTLLGNPAAPAQEQTTLAATGTDGGSAPFCTSFAPEVDSGCVQLMIRDGANCKIDRPPPDHNPLQRKEVEGEIGQLIGTEGNSPSRTRTYNKPVNSRLLYRLSYRGMRPSCLRKTAPKTSRSIHFSSSFGTASQGEILAHPASSTANECGSPAGNAFPSGQYSPLTARAGGHRTAEIPN